MAKPVRVTTTDYRWNAKHGAFQPTSMKVMISEEIDMEAEAAAMKAKQAAYEAQDERLLKEQPKSVLGMGKSDK